MTRTRKILLGFVFLIALLILAAIYFAFFYDWRHVTSHYAGTTTGRDVAIDGSMHVNWGRRTSVVLDNVVIGNMKDGSDPHMFSVEHMTITVDVTKLLKGELALTELLLEKPKLLLEKDAEGNPNWKFLDHPPGAAVTAAAPDKRSEFPAIQNLVIHDGVLTYKDPQKGVDVTLATSTVKGQAGEHDRIELRGEGNYNKKPFHLLLNGASVIALRDTDQPYPLHLELNIGDTAANIEGTVIDPLQLEGLDLTMRLKGADMAELFPILGVALPPTPPYDVKGHLTYAEKDKEWRFTDFAGRMGDSDLSGSAIWNVANERPKLTARFHSNRLDFDDLGGFIGGTPKVKNGKVSAKQAQKAVEQKASPYALPDAPLDISRLSAMDGDIEFTGKKVISPNLPLDNFYMKALLDNRELKLTPVKFGTADGDISTNMTINTREEPVTISADFTFRRLSLARLFEKLKIGDPTANRGYIGGTAKLSGTGKSLREMLATSNGAIGIGMEGGELSNLLIELIGLDIAESMGFLLTGDKPVKIRCVIGDFSVKDGVMQSNALVVDTADTNVGGGGTINLKDEKMDITLKPHPKDMSILALRAPLHVRGTLKHPDVSIDKEALIERGTVVAALSAILTPVAGILGFLETGLGKDSDCAALVAEMQADTGKKGQKSHIPVNKN